MTELGEYFARKAVNRAEISRKTGIDTTRLGRLVSRSRVTAKELYAIALALDMNPCDLLNEVCKDVTLPLKKKSEKK